MFNKIVNVLSVINAVLDKKVTAFGISIALLIDFVCLLILGLCLLVGAPVEGWMPLFVVVDTIWSYLDEKSKDNHYFYGE